MGKDSVGDLKFLKELQEELKAQDHDSQAAPRFWAIMDIEWVEAADDVSYDRVVVYNEDDCEIYEISDYLRLLTEDEDNPNWLGDTDELKKILSMDGRRSHKEYKMIKWVEERCHDVEIHYQEKTFVVKENSMFLTKQEAKDHLETNRHHYSNEAHTYAMTAWRAPKVERLFKILENFDWDSVGILGSDENEK